MSNARKLQTEIERCMKKVDEGVELFDEIWEKVYSADQQNQKEKYEMDLKKEIKKLQRQRDQIKTWISSSEVKDKDPLIEARKLIESKMEQFKICEKETKTKTYSKEGLAREDKLDPEEEAKLNTTTWLGEYIEKFNAQLEEKDFEIEKLSSGKGKKSHKAQLEALAQHVANHKFHISKLEGIIRLVNNDRLDVEVVDPLKEDLDYYLESYMDEDYAQAYDEEYFYEALGLDDLDIVNVDRVTQAGASDNNSRSTKSKLDDATSTSSRGSKERKSSRKSNMSTGIIPLTIGRARSKQEKQAQKEAQNNANNSAKEGNGATSQSNGSSGSGDEKTSSTTPSKGARASSLGVKAPEPAPRSTSVPLAPPPAAAATSQPGTSMAAILKRESEQQEKERQQKLREQQAKAQAAEQLRQQQQLLAAQQKQQQENLRQQEALRLKQQQQQQAQAEALRQQQETKLRQQQQEEAAAAAAAAAKQQQESLLQQQQQSLQAASQQSSQQPSLASSLADQESQKSVSTTASLGISQQQPKPSSTASTVGVQQSQPQANSAIDILTSGLGGLGLGGAATQAGASRPTLENAVSSSLPAVVGVADAGNTRPGAARPPYSSSALSDSFAAVPNLVDQERTSNYVPQNPYPTPASYPSAPSAIFDKPEVFEKLGTDALFFIFYYAQGSYQQYLAARELKKQSWRFHKKYMTWFQRHEEPQVTTDEYEQGTYVYFDYETGWCTRIKTDFRFEYSYLEDSLQ